MYVLKGEEESSQAEGSGPGSCGMREGGLPSQSPADGDVELKA